MEVSLAATGYDVRSLKPSLAMLPDDRGPGICRSSDNVQRLFEAVPGVVLVQENATHPLERGYRNIRVHINSLGFRDKERRREKREGTYRIVVLGGSNTYGMNVRDADTYPAVMERMLNAGHQGRFEVWNAGLGSYVLSQKAAYARRILREFDPDLLIIQHWNNGRRHFCPDGGYAEIIEANPELILENIPPLWTERRALRRAHYRLVSRFRVYRFLAANINNLIVRHAAGLPAERSREALFEIRTQYNEYGDIVNEREFRSFLRAHADRKIVLFNPFGNVPYATAGHVYSELPTISLRGYAEDKPSEYLEVHPPSYVYRWYARILIRELTRLGYIRPSSAG